MDFQRLFKRREGSASAMSKENARNTFNERDLFVCEGELLDGQAPASLNWSNVGGTISLKAEKILGILEGRTRIKAAVLQELYPGMFEKAPNPGTEYSIPLQAIVTQLEDIFGRLSSEEADLEGFDTPFGQLAREDEERFKEKGPDQAEARPPAARKSFFPQQPEEKSVFTEQDQSDGSQKRAGNTPAPENDEASPFDQKNQEKGSSARSGETQRDLGNRPPPAQQSKPTNGEFFPAFELRYGSLEDVEPSSDSRTTQDHHRRREGHESLQELYLTDEPLDGSRVADLILRLPRVAGVVIMLSDGAVLGGGLGGGLHEALLSVTPDFLKHLLVFTASMQGAPIKFVTFSGHSCHLSLTIGGDVLILTGHQRKNLPPGLRERLVATAQALSMIYGSLS
jgi:hypothetical protein